MVGSGIFASPGVVLLHTGSVGLSFIAWTAAGLVALLGVVCYAELGTMLPASGGDYAYIV
jgi:L-type amino acid transporter 9